MKAYRINAFTYRGRGGNGRGVSIAETSSAKGNAAGGEDIGVFRDCFYPSR